MEKIIEYFRRHGGYARMKDLKKASVQILDITRFLKKKAQLLIHLTAIGNCRR